MVSVKDQMVSELHHVVIDTTADNRIVSKVMAKPVADDKARQWNKDNLTDAFKVAYMKRDGSLIIR